MHVRGVPPGGGAELAGVVGDSQLELDVPRLRGGAVRPKTPLRAHRGMTPSGKQGGAVAPARKKPSTK